MKTPFVLVALILGSVAFATSPTKTPAPEFSAEATSEATAIQAQNSELSNSINIDETSIGLGLGAGSAHYTGDCVVPKKGRNGKTGFLERGWTLILLRVDPAVEVDEACIAHLRDMERLALENEAQRIALERERLAIERERLEVERRGQDLCFECSQQK